MGLDISAYKNLSPAPDGTDEESKFTVNGRSEYYFSPYVNPHFEGRDAGLVPGKYLRYEDRLNFRAGSYTGYGWWRNELAKLAGYKPVKGSKFGHDNTAGCVAIPVGPFAELINFSDCEGTIGPLVSKKLLSDFVEFNSKAAQIGGDFYDVYRNFRAAFEMAVENGAVDFH